MSAQWWEVDPPAQQAAPQANPQPAQNWWDADPVAPDAFAGDALLSSEAMSHLAAGGQSAPAKAPTANDRALAVSSGLYRGIADIAGLPVDTALNVWDLAKAGAGFVQGQLTGRAPSSAFDPSDRSQYVGSSEWLANQMSRAGAVTEAPQDDAVSRYLYAGARGVPGAFTGGAGAPSLARQAVAGAASGLAMQGAADAGADAGMQGLAAIAAGAGAGVARAPRRAAKPAQAPKSAIPSAEELADASAQLYSRAEQAGVVIHPKSTARAAAMIRQVAERENLGRLPPKISEAVSILEERVAQNQPLTLTEADKVRQIIGDAFASSDATDRRLAAIIRDRYDNDYLGKLGPQDTLAGNGEQAVKILREARALYRRKSNAELINRAIAEAQRKAEGRHTQSGMEHALRLEFEKIARNQKLMRTFTPEQRAAIEQVVKGDRVTNALRNLGKFDPAKGGMGATLGGVLGGGTGAALGGIVGGISGSAGGAAIGPLVLGTGANLAARGATRRTMANVERAREALVGTGLPDVDQVSVSPARPIDRSRAADRLGAEFDAERAAAAQAARDSYIVEEFPRSAVREITLETKPDAVSSPSTRDIRKALERLAEPVDETGSLGVNALEQLAPEPQLRNAAKSAVAVRSERAPRNSFSQLEPKTARTVADIEADLKKLDAKAQRLPADEPFDSPRMKAIETEYERLRKELATAKRSAR